MPDLRSLEERIAEVIREEAQHESVKVCCGDFENCRIPCTPRADHWKEKAKASYVPQPGLHPHKPADPHHSQLPPSSDVLPKGYFIFTVALLAVFVFGATFSTGFVIAWSIACH
jgi:hypothetical protein